MYSRKSFGYTPYTPPPNYNGVAFTRDFKPYSDIPESRENRETEETTAAAAEDITEIPAEESTPETEEPAAFETEYITPVTEEPSYITDSTDVSEPSPEDTEEIASIISNKDMKVEDLLLIGAVILFVSGEFDGDLMLLLGLLLIAGI